MQIKRVVDICVLKGLLALVVSRKFRRPGMEREEILNIKAAITLDIIDCRLKLGLETLEDRLLCAISQIIKLNRFSL